MKLRVLFLIQLNFLLSINTPQLDSADKISYRNHSDSSRRNSFGGSSSSLSGSRSLPPRRSSLRGSHSNLGSNLPGKRNSLLGSRESLKNSIICYKSDRDLLKKHINTRTFSYRIWQQVWNDCPGQYYSKNSYRLFRFLFLTEVNIYRSYHNDAYLVANQELNTLAQRLADKYAKRQHFKIDKYKNKYSNYGILFSHKPKFLASTIAKDWYDTKKNYDYFLHGLKSRNAFYFSQLVWRDSKIFGIGVAEVGGEVFVVCLFQPKGNIKFQYKKNVSRKVKWTHYER